MIPVDIICVNSDKYQPPIWNDIQAKSLEGHGKFSVETVVKTHVGGASIPTRGLLQSRAKTLITVDPSQHPFGINLESLRHKYEHLIVIADEPIWSPGAHPNAKNNHEQMLKNCTPDLVFYCSNIDKDHNHIVGRSWYSGFDFLLKNISIPKSKTSKAVCSFNNSSLWASRPEVLKRLQSLDFPIDIISGKSYNETTNILLTSKICVIPPHPLVIHWLRFLRAWFTGCLPVVINHEGWLNREDVKNSYQDILKQNGSTCLLINPSEITSTFQKLKDEDYLNSLLKNIACLNLDPYGIANSWDHVYNKVCG